MSHPSDSRRLKVCCTLAVTLEVTNLGTQLEFWNFYTLEVYSLALNLSIMGHLSNSQRLKVCCTLVATLEVTYLGTQLVFGIFALWRFPPVALSLSIMSYQLGLLSNPQRLKVCCTLVATYKAAYLGTQLAIWYFCILEVSLRCN